MPLRPIRAPDIDAISTWLPPVARDLGYPAWESGEGLRLSAGPHDALIYDEAAGIAVLSYENASPEPDAARIHLLAVAPGRRRLGIGSRAALALERRLRASTARLYVVVPARLGLALYFWLRLGYRPLTQAGWPARPEQSPSLWMRRELQRRS